MFFRGLVLATLLQLFAVGSVFAGEDTYDHHQHNIKLDGEKFFVNIRTEWNDDSDHVELGLKTPVGKVSARFVEDADRERRITYQNKVDLFLGLAVNLKADYKHFNKVDNQDHFVLKPELLWSNGGLWAKVRPEWNLHQEGQSDDMTVDAAKVALGYNYKLSENVTFGPFWEYKTLGKDDNWQRNDAFVGTNFKVKF